MNIVLSLVLTASVIKSNADVIRTVYCKNRCTDYLEIPEDLMPLCAAEHLKLKECGSVVSCDWAEADHDRIRPIANSSNISCCYQTVVKEKGDCVEQPVIKSELVEVIKPVYDICTFNFLLWLLCIVILVIVVLQAAYIFKVKISHPKRQKFRQSDETSFPQAVVSQPLVET